jgi:DNA-binding NarL/FixJ family response regulator
MAPLVDCLIASTVNHQSARLPGRKVGHTISAAERVASAQASANGLEAMAPDTPVIPRISVVDDDGDLHLFLKDLGKLGHFELVGSFYNAAQALEGLPGEPPDAVIMDIRLPDLSGVDCTSRLKTILPDLPILILTGYPDARDFFRSLMGGARGFLVKPMSAEELLNAMHDVLRGDFAIAKAVIPFLVQVINQVGQVTRENLLTPREEQVLACVFEGMQDKEIAAQLGIGTATVHTHMHRLFEKLGVHSRRDIVAKYLQFG